MKTITKEAPFEPIFVGAGVMGEILELSRERLRQLASAGHFPKAQNGQYEIWATLNGYLTFLRSRSSGDQQGFGLVQAKTREINARIERQTANLIETDDAEGVMANCLDILQRELARASDLLEGRVPDDLRVTVRANCETAIDRARKSFAESFADLRKGRPFHG